MHVFSKKDLHDGQRLIEEGRIVNVVFSGGTYQVEVLASEDSKETVWPFLQLSDCGEVMDAFCTCEEARDKGSCKHLAASSLKVGGQEPLHVRFRSSLWNQLGLLCAERHGYDAAAIQHKSGSFEAYSQGGERLFLIRPKSEEATRRLEELIFKRRVETEESSIKFSNLSQEELTLWRQGRPSPKLSYELSLWSDLAKWWMLMQDGQAYYKISFSDGDPPEMIQVAFADVEFECVLDVTSWPQLIPSLRYVRSQLPVHLCLQGALSAITFDRKQGAFSISFDAEQMGPTVDELQAKGTRVGEWIYYPKKGFYPRECDPLLGKKRIEPSEVPAFFKAHFKTIGQFLKDEPLHPQPHPLNYELYFEDDFTLVVCTYLFEKGDLQQVGAHFFETWAYLPGRGFFHLDAPLFKVAQLRIPKDKISDFVGRHRVWLHSFEGFQTHVSGIESHIGFRFEQEKGLTFYTRIECTEEAEKIEDLGSWIYVASRGFYEKIPPRSAGHIKPGLEVAFRDISQFIHNYREELEPIAGFFAPRCPLEKSGLHIGFNLDGKIQIDPEFFFRQGYCPQSVQIHGDYTYVPGEGFALIPHEHRLPEGYKATKVIDRAFESYFVSYELDLLYPHVLGIDSKLKRPGIIGLRLHNLKAEPLSKTGRWVLEVAFETKIGTVSIFEVWAAIQSGLAYIFSKAGLLFLRDRRFDWLRLMSKKRFMKKGTAIRLNTLEFLRLISIQDLLEPEGDFKKAKKTRALLHQFLSFAPPTPIDLTGLKSDLRPYQKSGVDWLWFLHSYDLSGLLCDEMGLGKTHQAMALIAGIKNHYRGKKPKFLVVCPTSVIYHWEKLIKQFLPGISAYVFHGIGRRFEAFSKGGYDLLLTSYGIVRTENKALSAHHFDLVVFDELQVAKNDKSLTHRALKNLDASMRLGLSGTPIENRLLELKALFDLVLPGYLPSAHLFRDTFVSPIEKHQDKQSQQMLSRLIHPFLLRRKKSKVLTELPEKFEEVVLCDLSKEQSHLYRSIIDADRDALISELKDSTKSPPIAHVFSMLTRLKQVCDHPCLVTGDLSNYKSHASGKWDVFLELLAETRDSGQKLVIFSQYLKMLDIMGAHFKKEGIEFAEIRGSTRARKEEIERFESDPKCEVFLGSLQAAGVGIDLVAASVVIHYDRWWNPAKENQATDRVHRMGQKRGVQVFKLVTKGTIEEHIHLLIEKKLSLAGGVIGFDDHDQIKGLNRQELIELLSLLH